MVSSLLILVTVYFGVSHGSRTFSTPSPAYAEMIILLGINDTIRTMIGVWSILSAVLILFPQTFFIGNILRAVLLILMMAFALKAGNYKFALIEIPFLLMPLVLIYLGHPLKNAF
ncbi:hypothetical protein L0657_22655 [Dyadobacter sp. CY345]|uniref:hypothetical protein n=1 Tax=Dyadobacter sp. CY345 TaxID=2909335 RepID=UPI001F3912B1|nr:hypothetical protein [Dyadobacter sp. CY345]MCF2446776.1 hypothetical protein [Dyadobacter sp. CY345]